MSRRQTELAVRAARAEIERDKALAQVEQLTQSVIALTSRDTEKILDTLHIIGIPARDLKDIYEIEQEWRRAGGCKAWLDLWRAQHGGKEKP